jgi:hypothetical protein
LQAKAEDLWAGLRDKTKNVIRRARENLTVCDIDDVNLFTNFYEQNLEGVESYFDLSFLASVYAAAHARQQGKIVAAVDSSGVVHAKVFFIWDDKYFHYFLSTGDRNVAHPGAVSLLVWTAAARVLISMAASSMTRVRIYRFIRGRGGKSLRYRAFHSSLSGSAYCSKSARGADEQFLAAPQEIAR